MRRFDRYSRDIVLCNYGRSDYKKDLEQYQKAIIEAMDFWFNTLETHFDQRLQKVESEISDLRSEIRKKNLAWRSRFRDKKHLGFS